jgi:hypothetical protein
MKTITIIFSFLMAFCLVNAMAQAPQSFLKSASDFGSPPNWKWAQQYGGTSADIGNDIVTDENGNIYITGSFSGTVTYPGNSFTSVGKRDAFVAKYNSSGTILWFKQFSASASDKVIDAYGIGRDNTGHLYITGYYTGSTVLGSFNLADMGPANYFFARLDDSGNVDLAGGPTLPHDDQQTGTVVKADNSGNIYMLISNNLDKTVYYNYSSVFSFDDYGSLRWIYSDINSIFDIEIYNNKIFYSGTINGEGNVGPFFLDPPNLRDAFLARSDLDGNFEWAQIPGHVSSGYSQGYGISVDENGNIYQSGYFRTELVFGEFQINGSSRTFVVKSDQVGSYQWADAVQGYYAFEICGNSDMIVTYCANNLTAFNSATGEVSLTMPVNHAPDKLYFCNFSDRIVTTGDFEQNIYISSFDTNLDLQWLWQFNSNSGLGFNVGTSMDSDGNIYSFNYASNAMDYLGEQVGNGMFLAKQDISGNLLWVRNFYDIQQPAGIGSYVLVDKNSGSVCITGSFNIPFDIPGITTLYPAEGGSYYIIKYDLNGNYIWHIQEDAFIGYISLEIDHSGNVLLSSTFGGTVTIGNQELVSSGGEDAFIAKYNEGGDFMWAISGGGESAEYMGLISTDSQDNIYLTGEFDSEEITFGNQSISLYEGDGNVFLAKVNQSGQVLWLKADGGSTIEYNDYWSWPTSIVTSPDGYSYVKGWHGDSTYFGNVLLTNPYSVRKNNNFFIARYDPSGDLDWVHSISESQQGYEYNSMDIDSEGNVYFGAQAKDSVWFEDDYMHNNPSYPNSLDLFIVKYSKTGGLDWVKILPSSTQGYGNNLISCVTVLAEDELIMGGSFSDNIELEPFILNSDNKHGMLAFLGDPLSVKDPRDPSSEFFSIYPNPVKDRLTVNFPEGIIGEMDISITDLSGKTMLKTSGFIKSGRINLNVSMLPAGVYFLEVNNLERSETKKLIIH